jgi:hypothetical protein
LSKPSPRAKSEPLPPTPRRASPQQLTAIRSMSGRLLGDPEYALRHAGPIEKSGDADRIIRALHQVDDGRRIGMTTIDFRVMYLDAIGVEPTRERLADDQFSKLSAGADGGRAAGGDVDLATPPAAATEPKKPGPKPKIHRGQPVKMQWHLAIAEELGLEGVAADCPKCGGTGTVPGKITKREVVRIVLGIPDASNYFGAVQAHERFINPRLTDLRRVAELIDGTLDDAAAWCEKMAGVF